MSTPFDELAALDRLIHEPARLAVTTALSACESADFLYLQRITGLSKGNLSSHLGKLETAGLVEITKRFKGKTPQTWVRLTEAGRTAVDEHWQRLDGLRRRVDDWRPDTGEEQ
ncbi:winged helix-turn-helix domain-containing protein [Allonocardiopsis opalescens]|uniref:ArsR family transcriptional regulator n=1 Tax=Allonocardiopsis opalescens TaxID=1144618 RepID=A0A2T0PU56_9ACTN|nr:transcriptional regulator [Allonocardiopsis opalescens]PRX92423.1 ArsR family transcriptional regulator [Allonocardiopsis opalescens]